MTTKQAAAAEIVSAVLLDENAILLLGRQARPLGGEGQLAFEPEVKRGSFAAVPWTGVDGRDWFLACLHGEGLLSQRPSALAVADGEVHPLPEGFRLTLESSGMVTALAAAGGALPAVVGFLRGQPGTEGVMADLLAATSADDGFIEIFGRCRGDELYLQGWSNSLATGEVDLLFETEGWVSSSAWIATYGRPDLVAPSHGIAAVVSLAGGIEARDVRRVYYWDGDRYCRFDVFENRLLMGDAETAAQAAAMLPQLQAAPVAHAALKRVARPRYQGNETLTILPVPVRAALDMALWVPGEGIFLAGWLLDPEQRVASVSLGTAGGWRARLDDRWTRRQRPDVSHGYSEDPLFSGSLQPCDHDHGFLAYVPFAETEPGEMYFEVELTDDQTAFLAVRPTGAGTTHVGRILSTVDPNHPDVRRIVETHLGPAVTAIGRRRAVGARPKAVYEFAGAKAEPIRLSVIVPVPVGRLDIDVTMARLAVEPTLPGVEVIFTASREAAIAIGPSLPRLARFYGLASRLAVTDGNDVFDAMTVAAASARGDLLLFLGAAVLPRQTGWLGQLERLLLAAPRAAAISPTLLYEDLSIRFAGSRASNWAPPKTIAGLTSFAGYARHWLAHEQIRLDAAVPVHAIAAECCLIRRAMFDEVGGFSGDTTGGPFKALDLSLKLRAARRQCLWATGIEMLAPDDHVAETDQPMRIAGMVDRWGFERKWSHVFG